MLEIRFLPVIGRCSTHGFKGAIEHQIEWLYDQTIRLNYMTLCFVIFSKIGFFACQFCTHQKLTQILYAVHLKTPASSTKNVLLKKEIFTMVRNVLVRRSLSFTKLWPLSSIFLIGADFDSKSLNVFVCRDVLWKFTFDFRKNAKKDKARMMLTRKNLQKRLYSKVNVPPRAIAGPDRAINSWIFQNCRW